MASKLELARQRIRRWSTERRQLRSLRLWEKNGCPNPPPHLAKQRMLRGLAERFGLKILVESGTFRGDMVEAMRSVFQRIYSIELSSQLCQAAQRRFANAQHVQIINGDSGVEIGRLLPQLDLPTLFWLDGHYSAGPTARGDKDTPIFEELQHILQSSLSDYVVVIDDARLFGADPAYPTLEQLASFVRTQRPSATIDVHTDAIQILQPQRLPKTA